MKTNIMKKEIKEKNKTKTQNENYEKPFRDKWENV